jgi:CHAT domain-containing protein
MGTDLALRGEIAKLIPLPDTRRELVAIASRVGEGQSLLFLGPAASERAVEEVDATDFRVVVFATHALMAGELPGLREPAIVLTPDARTNSRYDGLLTPTEVAQLKLDADLVVLSGCNTAAGDGSGLDEGFSGLARAFLFAGARGLLVSHWPVGSQATALLSALTVTDGLGAEDRDWGKALHGAMRAFVDAGSLAGRHPAVWSGFVYAGG